MAQGVDHFLERNQAVAANVEDLPMQSPIEQLECEPGGVVRREVLELACRIEPEGAALEDVEDRILPHPGADQSTQPQDQPALPGMADALLGEVFVKPVGAL